MRRIWMCLSVPGGKLRELVPLSIQNGLWELEGL